MAKANRNHINAENILIEVKALFYSIKGKVKQPEIQQLQKQFRQYQDLLWDFYAPFHQFQ